MFVRKRNGSLESVNLQKIVQSVTRVCADLGADVDVFKVATKTIGGLVDGATTRDIDLLSVRNAVGLIIEDPVYSKVAARIMAEVIRKEVEGQDIGTFSQCIEMGHAVGLISDQTHALVMANKRKLNAAAKHERDWNLEYHGIQTLYDRYLLKHPTATISDESKQRKVIEAPQYFFLRVSCGLANDAAEAIELYDLLSSLEYMTSTPTLFNSGTKHSQMSSCYLLDSPIDSLDDIYKRYADIALLSKFAGGIGVSYSRVRGKGALIKGTNGKSNGIVPWLHTLSGSVASVNQGGKRKGAACVYLETHHPDIMEFLELRDNTGEKEKRAYNLNIANWIPDLFMKRVKEDGTWSLFCPSVAPELTDLYGAEYEARYAQLEAEGKFAEQISARKVYARMMRTLAETGNGWMCWKDRANTLGNQVGEGRIIHLSNLCTEILEVTSSGERAFLTREEMMALTPEAMTTGRIRVVGFDTNRDRFEVVSDSETAVCNLGSLNLGRNYVKGGKLDKAKLRKNVSVAVRYLDRVIDRNFYPIPEARSSNYRWRPVGLGQMGFADLLFQLGVPFESPEATKLSAEIGEEIYYQALRTSCDLAKELGPHPDFALTRLAQGKFHFELAGGPMPADMARWELLRADILKYGVRNSLLIAIAPTATIAHICGAEECTEPYKSNLLKRETLSGEFIGINRYLVDDLKKLGLWTAEARTVLTRDEGSVANLPLPDDKKALYKTVWEMSMKAVIAHAAARGAYIDQSQSVNLFTDLNKYTPERRVAVLSSLYNHAWEAGLKTTYYFRSRSATRIQQATTAGASTDVVASAVAAPEMAAENPETCEACT